MTGLTTGFLHIADYHVTKAATPMPAEPFLRIEALVVDDDEAVREVISSYFTKLGMAVTGATDGRSAISILERSNGRFKVVVTDLSLPGADGLAVLKAARHANASSYVVIVTGYASLDSAIAAVRLGAHDYLTKPFSLGQLDVILRRIADRESLEQENRALQLGDGLPAPGRPGLSLAELADRLTRIESALGRIESSLGTHQLATLHRR
jgi:DNA-binding NtrC family response regulator